MRDRAYHRDRYRRHRHPDDLILFAPAGRVREHLVWLESQGVSLRTVARVSGVSRSTLHRIRCGLQRRVRPEVGRRVLEVTTGVGA